MPREDLQRARGVAAHLRPSSRCLTAIQDLPAQCVHKFVGLGNGHVRELMLSKCSTPCVTDVTGLQVFSNLSWSTVVPTAFAFAVNVTPVTLATSSTRCSSRPSPSNLELEHLPQAFRRFGLNYYERVHYRREARAGFLWLLQPAGRPGNSASLVRPAWFFRVLVDRRLRSFPP